MIAEGLGNSKIWRGAEGQAPPLRIRKKKAAADVTVRANGAQRCCAPTKEFDASGFLGLATEEGGDV